MNHHGPITKAHQPVRDRDALLPAALEVVLDRHGDMRGGVFGGFGAAEILPTLRGAMKLPESLRPAGHHVRSVRFVVPHQLRDVPDQSRDGAPASRCARARAATRLLR